MERNRRILHAGVVGAVCFVVGLVLVVLTLATGTTPLLAIGVAVLGMLLVGAALEHRGRAVETADLPVEGDIA